MKILIGCYDYPSEGHAVFVFVEQLVNQLIANGIEIIVVAPQSLSHMLIHKQPIRPRKDYAVSSTGVKYKVYRPFCFSVGDKIPALSRAFDSLWTKSVENIVRKEKPDVLYAHFWTRAVLMDGIARKYHKPLFVACGEGDNALEDMMAVMSAERKSELAKSVTGVISVSSENKRKCLKYGLCKDENIVVLPNAADTNTFRYDKSLSIRGKLGLSDDDFVISFCGAFIKRKGSKRLSDAITSLNDPSIKSIFIGKSFEGEDESPTCNGIVFKGSLDHQNLPQYLNSSDIFVLPTQKEGCCNAIVEALACGLPVISSDGAFNDDILDNNNSIRINPDNTAEIAQAIKTLKENKELRDSMRNFLIETQFNYSLEARAKKIIAFIESLT